MTSLIAVLLAAAVPAGSFWGSGAETVKVLEAEYNAGRYESVIAQLDPSGLQRLRGDSLRRGYLLLGASYERTGRADKSLSVYQVGVRIFPRNKELLIELAGLLHKAGLEEQAQPLFEKLVRIDPESPNGHLGLAQIDRALGFLDRSADHYEVTLKALEQRADIWQEYGETLFEARDYRTAELALRRSLALAAKDSAVLDLALILRALGRVDEALAELEPLASAGRDEALRARALWLLEAGRDAQAGAEAEALLRRGPPDPLALYVRARLALRAGRRDQAVSDLRQAASLGAESPFTAKACAALASLAQGVR